MLMRTDPFRELDRLTERLLGRGDSQLTMPMDAWREDETFTVQIDLPGVREEDIDLEVERNVLTVRAERRGVEAEGRELIQTERPSGTFVRRLFLSEALDTEHMRAFYDDGVLTLTIPTAEEAKPRKVLVGSRAGQIEQ
ncbi:MAG TPA: Hsp20/alpha crystallin family protein [Glycomyces sp.]|nr:Hsp20/alpha crystallin family protein [Glycomyces sp.]